MSEQRAKKLMRRAREEAKKETEHPGKGVIYLGHIPHGFYEEQIRDFFTQFGTVTRVRVARSKKTARSKGFAYVEFSNAEVAKISAKALNGYLMLGRALVAVFVPRERLHKDSFKGADKNFRRINFSAMARRKLTENGSKPENIMKRRKRLLNKRKKKQEKLEKLGISYTFPKI